MVLLKFESYNDYTGGKYIQMFCAIYLKMSFPVMIIYKACNETQREENTLLCGC